MVVQGAYISCDPDNPIEVNNNSQFNRLFKVEIWIGGREPTFNLLFQKIESCFKWKKALTKASGNFSLDEFYELQDSQNRENLGEGARSLAYRGVHKQTKQQVAIKQIVKKDLEPQDLIDLAREVELKKVCVHNYVVRLLDTFECRKYFYMVVELENGDTLMKYLAERNNLIKEERAKDIA